MLGNPRLVQILAAPLPVAFQILYVTITPLFLYTKQPRWELCEIECAAMLREGSSSCVRRYCDSLSADIL